MRSKIQEKIYNLLRELFPNARIKEEFKVKYKRHTLFFDFYIPFLNLVIEVDGIQHKKFSRFFYDNHLQFYEALRRDRLKEDWAVKNRVNMLRISEEEVKKMSRDRLLEKIKEVLGEDGEQS